MEEEVADFLLVLSRVSDLLGDACRDRSGGPHRVCDGCEHGPAFQGAVCGR